MNIDPQDIPMPTWLAVSISSLMLFTGGFSLADCVSIITLGMVYLKNYKQINSGLSWAKKAATKGYVFIRSLLESKKY